MYVAFLNSVDSFRGVFVLHIMKSLTLLTFESRPILAAFTNGLEGKAVLPRSIRPRLSTAHPSV
jgi:hypothetical protein